MSRNAYLVERKGKQIDEERQWRVSLAPDFVVLETLNYQSRDDFLARLGIVLASVERCFSPTQVVRLGLRYTDRVISPELARVSSYIRPEVLGVAGTAIAASASLVISEMHLRAEEGLVQARWGWLPGLASIDPTVLEPLPEPSWVLDLDVSATDLGAFDADALRTMAGRLAQRGYALFRWIVTPAFLAAYGAEQ